MSEVKTPALVVRSYDEISSLIHGSAETVVIRNYVEPSEEDKAHDGQLEIVSCFTPYTYDIETGTMEAIHIQMKALDENGEETNQGKTHVSFGGTLDVNDILVEGTLPLEGQVTYELSKEEFVKVVPQKAVDAFNKAMGTDKVFAIEDKDVVVFQANGNPNKLVVSTLIQLSKEEFDELLNVDTFDKDAINQIAPMGIAVGEIIVSFNVAEVIKETVGHLAENSALDPLSAVNVDLILRGCVNQTLSRIEYKDVLAAVRLREASERISDELNRSEEAVAE